MVPEPIMSTYLPPCKNSTQTKTVFNECHCTRGWTIQGGRKGGIQMWRRVRKQNSEAEWKGPKPKKYLAKMKQETKRVDFSA